MTLIALLASLFYFGRATDGETTEPELSFVAALFLFIAALLFEYMEYAL